MASFSIKQLLGLGKRGGNVQTPNTPQGAGVSTITLDRMASQSALDFQAAEALGAMYGKSVETREDFMKQFMKVRDFYMVDAILTLYSDDALTPDTTSGEVVEVTSDNPTVKKLLEELQEEISFDGLVNDLIMDLLSFGEYTLRLKVEPGNGVVEVVDDVVQKDMVAFYRKGTPYCFMQKMGNNLTLSAPVEFAHFTLGNRKLRINLGREFEQSGNKSKLVLPDGLPTYVRIGKPLLFGVLGKIKELQLLENLVPAAKLKQITAGNIVGVQVPPTTSPKDGFAIVQKYQNLLNKKIGIDLANQDLSVADILNHAGETKVIPIFGDKGSLETVDVRENRNVDDLLSNIKDTREVILSSIGIPPALLFGDDGPKSEILKRYARYVRKLKSIQTAVSNGLKQVCLAHLANSGAIQDIKLDDIKVNFRNQLVNVDSLDKLEFSTAVIQTLRDMNEFIGELQESETLRDVVNVETYKKFLKEQLILIGCGYDFSIDGDKDDDQEVDFPDGEDPDAEDDAAADDDVEEMIRIVESNYKVKT